MPTQNRPVPPGAPFREGDVVTVFNEDLFGKPIREGVARIIGGGKQPDEYRVKFIGNKDDSRQTYFRTVYPGDSQETPDLYLALRMADWEARRPKRGY